MEGSSSEIRGRKMTSRSLVIGVISWRSIALAFKFDIVELVRRLRRNEKEKF